MVFGGEASVLAPPMARLGRQQVYSVDPDGFIFSCRVVRELAQNQVGRHYEKQGGNVVLVAPEPDAPYQILGNP